MPNDRSPFTADELLAELRRREHAVADKSRSADLLDDSPHVRAPRSEQLEQVKTTKLVIALKEAQRSIYGVDNRKDAFDMPAGVRRLADASVGLVKAADLQRTNGKWTLRTSSFRAEYRLCSDEPFATQPLGCFCSGVLVAPSVIATAGHCVESAAELAGMRFVFGFHMTDKKTARTTFPDDDVYKGTRLIGHQLTADGTDWALVQLDRPVTGRTPVKFRTSGKVADKERLFVIGHPCGLPQKFADDAQIRQNSIGSYFTATLDTYGGNSGSPVFNAKTKTLEGLLVRGQTDFVWVGNCRVSQVYPSTGSGGEDVTRSTVWSPKVPKKTAVGGARFPARKGAGGAVVKRKTRATRRPARTRGARRG